MPLIELNGPPLVYQLPHLCQQKISRLLVHASVLQKKSNTSTTYLIQCEPLLSLLCNPYLYLHDVWYLCIPGVRSYRNAPSWRSPRRTTTAAYSLVAKAGKSNTNFLQEHYLWIPSDHRCLAGDGGYFHHLVVAAVLLFHAIRMVFVLGRRILHLLFVHLALWKGAKQAKETIFSGFSSTLHS